MDGEVIPGYQNEPPIGDPARVEWGLAIAQDEIIKTLRAYNAPFDIYPTEVQVREGPTSVYVWDYQNDAPSPLNGNIYISKVLLLNYPESYVRKVARHETFHLLQEKVMDRDMTDKVRSELEAESLAIRSDPSSGSWPELPGRQRPMYDLATIKMNPMKASTCFVKGSFYGIEPGVACYCATFNFNEDDGRILMRLLGLIPGA